MVKIVRAALVVLIAFITLAALASLAGCKLGAGIFPERLMSYEAFADLSRFIDRDHVWNYRLQLIRDSRPTSGYPEYLVLSDDNGSWGDDCVVILDADLKALGHWSMSKLDDMDPGNPFGGKGAMVDETGCIVVGNRRFEVTSRGARYLSSLSFDLHHVGLTVWDAFDRNIVNIRGDGQNLVYDRYNASWVFMAGETKQFSTASYHEVMGVWLTDAQVLLAVGHEAYAGYGHVLAMDDMAFATGGLSTPLLDQGFAVPIPSNADIEWDTLGYTNEGFAAFRRSPFPQYFMFNELGAETGVVSDEIPERERPWNQRHLYGRTSGWYIMDMKAMTLERRKWWWK